MELTVTKRVYSTVPLRLERCSLACLLLIGVFFAPTGASAQAYAAAEIAATSPASAPELPDAPGWTQTSASTSSASTSSGSSASQTAASQAPAPVSPAGTPEPPLQTKRILGIIPNYRSVSADEHLPPQTVKAKFLAAGHDSFDYGSFVLAAIQAGFAFNSGSYPQFHYGVVGYGRYYWHTLADTADENFMVGGVFPAVLHQDPRFYTKGHGTIAHRALYASSRVLLTRTDNGNPTFNASEILGAGAASGISSLYYPGQYRTWTKVGQKWLTSVLIDGANFAFKEFWPDINGHLLHGRGGVGSGTE